MSSPESSLGGSEVGVPVVLLVEPSLSGAVMSGTSGFITPGSSAGPASACFVVDLVGGIVSGEVVAVVITVLATGTPGCEGAGVRDSVEAVVLTTV